MRKVFFILVFLSLACTIQAQKSKRILSIKELTDSIEVIMYQEHIPGLMMGITTRDSTLFVGGLGLSNIEEKRPVDKNQLFRLGSVTKMFVALGILKLQQEGRININDEIKRIAPEVPFENEWEEQYPLRVVHLLEHTSGFDDIKLNRFFNSSDKDNLGLDAVVVHRKSLVSRWKPGERFSYSNPNYAVLGYLIEKLTKQPYDQYITKNILLPLGMTHSNFNLRPRNLKQEAQEYIYESGRFIKIPFLTLTSGAFGTFRSCSIDMIKFIQMFLRNGQPVFPEIIINEMETSHSSLGAKAGLKFGYGLASEYSHFYDKYFFRGHNGLVGTTFSSCLYNRELGVGYILSSNSNNNMEDIDRLIASYLEQDFPERVIKTQPLDKKSIEPYLGFYQFDSPRNKRAGFMDKLLAGARVYIEDDTLYNETLFGEKAALLQVAPLTFLRKGMNIPSTAFTITDEGKKVKMEGGIYFEKRSYFWAILYRSIAITAALFAGLSIVLFIASAIETFKGKLKWQGLLIRTFPVIAVGFLTFALLHITEVQYKSYLLIEFNSITRRSLIIFIGTLLFGILSLFMLGVAIWQIYKARTSWFAWYYLLTACSLCFIAFTFWTNDWIGIRMWVRQE